MLAMQGQLTYSFAHGVLIRTGGAGFADLQRAFEERLLVRHRPMRGTLHVTCAKDYHWLRLTLNRSPGGFVARGEERYGITESLFAEAAEVVRQALALSEDRGIGRKELFALWTRHFKKVMPDDVSQVRFCQHLMWGLDRRGILLEGPLRKNGHLFIDGATLPAADSSQSGFCLKEDTSREEALADAAYRYVRGHGPVSVADFARWASVGKGLARAAFEFNTDSGRLRRYTLTDRGLAPYKRGTCEERTYYMEPSLKETLQQYVDECEGIRFLPAFDELHVGYENRTCLTDEAGERAICPAKNGAFKPLIVQNGRLIAVYPKAGLCWLVKADRDLKKAVEQAIDAVRGRMVRP